jgi:hypothetical protein
MAASEAAAAAAAREPVIAFTVQDDGEPVQLPKRIALMLGTVKTMMDGALWVCGETTSAEF